MLDWLRNLLSRKAPPGDSPSSASSAAPSSVPPPVTAAIGRWVRISLGDRWPHPAPFVGFVYLDRQAGLSAKGGPEGSADLAERPGHTLRLPLPDATPQPLSLEEVARLALPVAPAWLSIFGPQPDPQAPWRRDPHLAGRFNERFPDDLLVLVHDGEPRRTGRRPEGCWVRLRAAEPAPARRLLHLPDAGPSEEVLAAKHAGPGLVYIGTLLNQPAALTSLEAGDEVLFLSGTGGELPVLVTRQYLAERPSWRIAPCNRCGLAETLDPPSVMGRTRFPNRPPDEELEQFTSLCPACGGMQMLSRER